MISENHEIIIDDTWYKMGCKNLTGNVKTTRSVVMRAIDLILQLAATPISVCFEPVHFSNGFFDLWGECYTCPKDQRSVLNLPKGSFWQKGAL